MQIHIECDLFDDIFVVLLTSHMTHERAVASVATQKIALLALIILQLAIHHGHPGHSTIASYQIILLMVFSFIS